MLPGSTMLPRLMLYNNVGLTCKASEETKRESTENCRCRQPHCRLISPFQGTPATCMLYFLEARQPAIINL